MPTRQTFHVRIRAEHPVWQYPDKAYVLEWGLNPGVVRAVKKGERAVTNGMIAGAMMTGNEFFDMFYLFQPSN